MYEPRYCPAAPALHAIVTLLINFKQGCALPLLLFTCCACRPFKAMMSAKQLVEYVVLDVELMEAKGPGAWHFPVCLLVCSLGGLAETIL